MGGVLTGLFVILFLAALFGAFKPYINGAKRWHFGLGAFVAFILLGAFAEPESIPKNKVAAAAANDLAARNVPSGKPLGEPRPLDGHGVTQFAPDGRIIAAAANLGVRLLDGDTLAPLPGGYLPHPDPITDVAFSPDGAFLLTAHETGSAQLWDVATRKPVGPPAVLIGPILSVAFTPDGKTCVCVAADGTVRRWPMPAPFV